jgi:hypothetical protein
LQTSYPPDSGILLFESLVKGEKKGTKEIYDVLTGEKMELSPFFTPPESLLRPNLGPILNQTRESG